MNRRNSNKSASFNSCVEVLQNCEELLGVYNVYDGKSSEFLPIHEYLERVLSINRSKEDLKILATKCGYYMTSLAYTRCNCSFRRISVLNFSEHNRIDLLCNLLVPFLKRENITSFVLANNEYLIKYLEILENQNSNFIKTMSYRMIRLFITFSLNGMLMLSAVVAEFILDQIFLSEDLDNSIRQKVEELISTRSKVDEISDKFINVSKSDPSSEKLNDEIVNSNSKDHRSSTPNHGVEESESSKTKSKESTTPSSEEASRTKENKDDLLSMLFGTLSSSYDPDSLVDFEVDEEETKSMNNFSEPKIFKRGRK